MLSIIRMIVVGLIVGILARFFYPGAVPLNWLWSIVLGIAGSFVAGLVIQLTSGSAGARPFHPAGFIGSVLGAILLIFLGRVFHLL